ncbi:MAG TPA: alpha/beta hydrolase [Kofleriaceae bacterium]
MTRSDRCRSHPVVARAPSVRTIAANGRVGLIGLLCIIGATSACSDPGTTVVMTTADEAPAYGTTPFPTDALREGNRLGVLRGLDALVDRHADKIAAHLASLDGFGVRPLVEFFVTGELDEAALPVRTASPTDAAVVIDIDPSSPERGRVIAMDWRYDAERLVLQGAPASGERLREGTRYAGFVTTAIKPLRRASAFDDLPTSGRWQTTAEAVRELDAMHRAGAIADEIAGVTVFTTQHATAPLVAARDIVARLPPSELTFPDSTIIFSGRTALDRVIGVATRASDGPRAGLERWGNDNPTGIAHEHVGVIGSGEMTTARFRSDDTGTDLPDDETFADPPAIVAMDAIPVTFILPATPMPADGYPIVIYGHGLGASRDQLLSFAEPLTSRGYAIVGIDMAGHGSRFDPSDNRANMANQLPSFSGDGATRDGFGDVTGLVTQFDFFEGFLGVSAVRDSIRQSALDLGRVAQMIRRPDLDLSALAGPGSANPKLDTRRIAYLGESFGTVVGSVFSAIEPNVDLYVLDVPGGGILDRLLTSSAEIGSLAIPLVESIYGPKHRVDRFNSLIGMMQSVIDGADPLTYAPHVLRDRFTIDGTVLGPRSIVCIEVLGDQVLSNEGTDALARGLGLDVLAPNLAPPDGVVSIESPAAGNRDGQTAILVQYAPATHGGNWSSEKGILRYLPGFPHAGDTPFPRLPAPITITNPIYDTHAQVAEILDSHRAGEAPRVRSTRAPIADFDDDGTPDATDPAPYDPAQR